MEDFVAVGRSMPIFALAPTIVVTFVLMLLGFKNVQSIAARYVGWAVYVRFAAGALHSFTFQRSPLGVSYNALISLLICIVGLFVVRRRPITDVSVFPFLPLLFIILVSGIINNAYSELATGFIKYAYLIIFTMTAIDAFRDIGSDRLFRLLLISMMLPLFLQLLSVILHLPKPGETDGADSYIGGYNHEASFSIMLLVGVLAACFLRNVSLAAKTGMVFYGISAISLANYRTSILSMLPLVAASLLTAVPRVFVNKQRFIVFFMVLIATCSLFLVGTIVGGDRFSDIEAAFQEHGQLIKRPESFSPADRRIMSGRPYIWSMYYYAWSDAPLKQKLIGFGAETWSKSFKLYAHNTLLSTLYELGIIGVLSVAFMWIFLIFIAFSIRVGPRFEIFSAHVSFLILNMATMPLWQIEGVIFYAILSSYTVYCFILTRQIRLT